MRIAIDYGHNCQHDRGAAGITQTEDQLTKELGQNLAKLLTQEGHTCIFVTPALANNLGHSLSQRVQLANFKKCDLYVSLHFNAFNRLAFGSEVYAIAPTSQKYATQILSEIAKLGFFNRGVKSRNFYVLKHTQMPAVLVECCFCDSPKDMELYDPINMAIAIKNGILGKTSYYTPLPKQQYLKIIPEFTWLKSSTEQSDKIQSKTKIARGVYTIESIEPEEEGHFWVKLKSGSGGFIYSKHLEIKNTL